MCCCLFSPPESILHNKEDWLMFHVMNYEYIMKFMTFYYRCYSVIMCLCEYNSAPVSLETGDCLDQEVMANCLSVVPFLQCQTYHFKSNVRCPLFLTNVINLLQHIMLRKFFKFADLSELPIRLWKFLRYSMEDNITADFYWNWLWWL